MVEQVSPSLGAASKGYSNSAVLWTLILVFIVKLVTVRKDISSADMAGPHIAASVLCENPPLSVFVQHI